MQSEYLPIKNMWSWLKLIPLTVLIISAIKTNQRFQEDVHRGEDRVSHLRIMDSLGIRCPKVVCCQMLLETADLTSKIYVENHNGFGMKYNQHGYADYTLNGHAHYHCIVESILDYKEWQDRFFKDRVFKSDEEYMYTLQHLPGGLSYAEDPNYISKLKIKYKKYYQ